MLKMSSEEANHEGKDAKAENYLVRKGDCAGQKVSLWKIKNFPTIFGKPRESNITFCIDTSGSMYNVLDIVKEHVIEVLFQKAQEDKPCYFNVVEFSTNVTQWSDRMVQCKPQTVAVAAQWISKLEAKSGTNTLDALLSAFSDHCCDAVYLVTDGNPDQHANDILDSVVYAAQNRPVHSFYVQTGEDLDPSSFNFMREMAHETYGSFHTVIVTKEGAIDRVTPIFRAEGTGETIVRSTDGTIFPDTGKQCTVTTTLASPPQPASLIVHHASPVWPYYPYYYTHPYRYDIYPAYPFLGWAHHRPARAWSKFTQELADAANIPPVPGPGATLIGIKVLARRKEDGLFYLGSVKSQILHDKFLIEFSPVKHGKYKDTVYQETFVYDIISHADALRHAILKNDKVLARFEPEGERYAPGVVLQGQEKRCTEGGGEDSKLIVSFYNGKSADVPINTAIWVPSALHDRITFEIQLPASVRKELSERDEYPSESHPGYPTSGPVGDPNDFEKYDPRCVVESGPYVYAGEDDVPFYLPYMYPVHYKYIPRPSAVKCDDIESMVPGTDLTKSQLNEKVMRQLMEHKMCGEQRRTANSSEEHTQKRLLEKRTTERESSLKKSVHFDQSATDFRDDLSDIEAEYYSGDLELRDSGHGSASDLEVENVESGDEKDTKDAAVGTSDRLLRGRHRRYRPRSKPRWQYWGTDPSPNMLYPMHFGPYRVGPYDPVVAAAPMELRNNRISKYGLEWANAMTDYVDPYGRHIRQGSVPECMGYRPHPPGPGKIGHLEKQGPGRDICDLLGEKQLAADVHRQLRVDFRRQVALDRESSLVRERDDKYAQHQIMRDLHKERILAQIDRERQAQINEAQRIERTSEAKKQINDEFRRRIEGNQERERQREEGRLSAMQRNRAMREAYQTRQQEEHKQLLARRQEAKENRAQVRHDAVQERYTAEQLQAVQREAQARQTKLNRIEFFRQKEERNQKVKELQAHVSNNSGVVFRASVLL